jgi:ABC-type phosphate transport system substrate-binding protein
MPTSAARHSRSRRVLLSELAAAALALLVPSRASGETSAEFVVVVHPEHPSESAAREFLADAFLKRTTRWEHGEAIAPVDLPAGSRTRKAFSERVLKRSVGAVRSYWQQRIFSGRGVPPPELDSDEAVLRYVSSRPGAVGYVSGGAKLDNARVLRVT